MMKMARKRKHDGWGPWFLCLCILLIPANAISGKTSPGFTQEEHQWLESHPVITVIVNDTPAPISIWGEPPQPLSNPPGSQDSPLDAPDQGKPPMSGHHGSPPPQPGGSDIPLVRVTEAEQDEFKGVAADYLKEIEAIAGIRFKVVLASMNNFSAMHDALMDGDADLMPSAMLEENGGPFPYVTKSYIHVPVVIVTQPGVPHLDDVKALESMSVAGVHSIRRKLRRLGLNIDPRHANPESGILGVATGKYDAFICELSGVSHALTQNPVTNIKISGELPDPSRFAMAVSPKMKEFIPIFNKALAAIPQKQKDIIWKKWFSIPYEKKWISSPWVRFSLAGGGLVIIVVVAALYYVHRRFRRIMTAVEAMDPHLLSVHTDHNIIITEATEAFCRATGFESSDLVGRPLMALGSPVEDNPTAHVCETLKSGKPWKGEIELLKKDGSALWVEAVVSPLRRKNEQRSGYTAIYRDLTEQKHYQKLAVRDELTGLYNRRYFNEIGPVLLSRARDENRVFALILMDVDYFKQYNDTYGHPAGDKVLAAIGRELRAIFQRCDDMVFRMGGEEFGAVLVVPAPDDATTFGNRILHRIRKLGMAHEHNPPGVVTVSIGIGIVKDVADQDLDSVYKTADHALYRAKEGGRNRVVLEKS